MGVYPTMRGIPPSVKEEQELEKAFRAGFLLGRLSVFSSIGAEEAEVSSVEEAWERYLAEKYTHVANG